MPSKIKMLEKEVNQRDRFKLASWEQVRNKDYLEISQSRRVKSEIAQLQHPELADEISNAIMNLTQSHKLILDQTRATATELLYKSHPSNNHKVNPQLQLIERE